MGGVREELVTVRWIGCRRASPIRRGLTWAEISWPSMARKVFLRSYVFADLNANAVLRRWPGLDTDLYRRLARQRHAYEWQEVGFRRKPSRPDACAGNNYRRLGKGKRVVTAGVTVQHSAYKARTPTTPWTNRDHNLQSIRTQRQDLGKCT